jgi:competence protein ComEC
MVTAVYGAGLLTGLARFGDAWTVLLPLLGVGLLSRRTVIGWLCLAALLGRGSAAVALRGERDSCRARLPGARVRALLEAEDPIAEGGLGEARLPDGSCTGTITVRWPAGANLSAGDRVLTVGRWLPDPGTFGRADGIFLVQQFRSVRATPGAAQRLHTWVTRTSAALYGSRAGIVNALVLNARGGMSPELRNQYARAGLVHILSISGFHVGLIAAWMLLLLRGIGLNRVPAMLWAALVSVGYVIFLGWPAPAARAAAFAVLVAVCRARQRQPESGALLATTCLGVMVIDPWAIVDLSAWLSAGALWGAMTLGRWSDHALGPRWWWRVLSSSVGATLATAPLTAAAFGTVSLVGIALNFAAIPLAALAVPGVLASLLTAPLTSHLAGALAAGSAVLLAAMDQLARWGAALPGGCVAFPADWQAALPWLGVLGVTLWGIAGGTSKWEALRRWALALVLVIWSGTLVALSETGHAATSDFTLHFLDVGQGDAAVLRTPGGHWIVVDAGPRTDQWDAGRRVVVPYLMSQGVARVDVVVVSHAHADHLGGVPAVLDRYPPALILEPGEPVHDPLYLEFLDRAAGDGAVWKAGRPGDHFEIDGVRFSVLHPDTTWTHWREDLNEDSLVLLVEYRGFQALLAGDAGFIAESDMLSHAMPVDLLKVGHHGSRTATSDEWLSRLAPRAAVVSVGRVNRYGHPNPEALARLARHQVAIWRTDRDGTVDVTTDGHSMTIRGRGRVERYAVQ